MISEGVTDSQAPQGRVKLGSAADGSDVAGAANDTSRALGLPWWSLLLA